MTIGVDEDTGNVKLRRKTADEMMPQIIFSITALTETIKQMQEQILKTLAAVEEIAIRLTDIEDMVDDNLDVEDANEH